MECSICLLNFENNYAYIPELPCNCTIVVHEECWIKWQACIYCRQPGMLSFSDNIPDRFPIILVGQPEIQTIYARRYLLAILVLLLILSYISMLLKMVA